MTEWAEGVCGDGAVILHDGRPVAVSEILGLLGATERVRDLLAEGLDLCVRARAMDAMDRREATLNISTDTDEWKKSGGFGRHLIRHNILNPDQPISTRSGTVRLWLQDQYEHDLADWERRTRRCLMGSL